MSASAILVPGYRGTEKQRLIVTLAGRLGSVGIESRPAVVMSGPRPSREYADEIGRLRAARDALLTERPGPVALVGRSFGGRICAFLATEEPPAALVIVGHPIAPPERPRPRDEAALASVRCPTLVVQGENDELGPLSALRRISAPNPLVDIVVIAGAGHELTAAQERAAVEHVARWLSSVLPTGSESGS